MKQSLREDPEALQKTLKEASDKLETLQDELAPDTQAAILANDGDWLRELLELTYSCVSVQALARNLDVEPEQVVEQAADMLPSIQELFADTREDLRRMNEAVPIRESLMDETEKRTFRNERERLNELFSDLENDFNAASSRLETTQQAMNDTKPRDVMRSIVTWVADILEVVNRLSLIPAKARLEAITVEPVELAPETAFEMALSNRLDFMNGRAALVDSWREIDRKAGL